MGFLNIQFISKYQKNEGAPLQALKNLRKKFDKAEKNSKGGPQPRPILQMYDKVSG